MVQRFALAGSGRDAQKHARVVGTPNPSDTIDVTLFLRRGSALEPRQVTPHKSSSRISREDFARRHGADDRAVASVDAFARHFDLTVVDVDCARRTVVLSGSIASMGEAFGTTLKLYQGERGVYRGRTGELYPPAELEDVVIGVFGLDNRPQARPRSRRYRPLARSLDARRTSYTPDQIARLYGFPATTGRGQTIAILELGGGYRVSDLHAYFDRLNVGMPSVTAVSVDGAHNIPTGDPNGPDGEVLLDIEVAGAIASGAALAVYFAPNTDRGFLDAITTALHDPLRKPSVISISWGGPEPAWTRQALQVYDQVFQDAAALGVTICCAAGDNGSDDGMEDGRTHVDFPASSPHVLACGGTRVEASSGAIDREVVWNEALGGATGGGVSDVFERPVYQESAGVPVSVNRGHFKGRGVPDVAGNADPATGYEIRVDGHDAVFGGTSAVAPLWAALIALRNEALDAPLGFVNPALYASAGAGTFRDITLGDNGAYRAAAGWDPCTGLGSPTPATLLPVTQSSVT